MKKKLFDYNCSDCTGKCCILGVPMRDSDIDRMKKAGVIEPYHIIVRDDENKISRIFNKIDLDMTDRLEKLKISLEKQDKGIDDGNRCIYFDKVSNICTIYEYRPEVCRMINEREDLGCMNSTKIQK